MIETQEIDAGELVFRARVAGPADGRTVFLLHGFPQTSHAWRHVMPVLADAGFRVVAPDQRGYSPGARPEPVEAYRVPFLVNDVMAMADSIGAHQVDVVGHDWGGAVAWQLAARRPDRVRTLTAVSTPHPKALTATLRKGGDQAERSSYMKDFRSGPGAAEAALLGRDGDGSGLRSLYASSGLTDDDTGDYLRVLTEPGALTAALNWYRAANIEDVEACGPITVPTLYVWSTEDAALGRDAAEATASHVDGPYRFEVLEGVDHWIPELAHEVLVGLILEHLGAHS